MSHWVFPESKIECRRLEDVWGESWGFPTMQVQTCITDESSKRLPDVLESPISSCNKGSYSVHHGSSIAVSPGHSSPCETRSPCGHGCGMLWLHGEPSFTNAASLSVSEWGSSHSLLLGLGFTISRLGVSERGIFEPHHFGSIQLSHLFSWCRLVPKFVEWWGLVGAAAVCVSGTGTSRRCGILTPLNVKWAYVASNLWTPSPCLNCVGWWDKCPTGASSPCLNCVGWQDKSSL